jgi:hypothetical protein
MPGHVSAERLNHILNLFTDYSATTGSDASLRIFESNEALTLAGENIRTFEAAIDKLLASIPTATDTVSRKSFEERLLSEIGKKRANGDAFSQEDANQFLKQVLEMPVQDLRVLRRLYGVMLNDDVPVKMGTFSILTGRHLKTMISRPKLAIMATQPIEDQEAFIECSVKARDTEKAVELADALFYRFELMARFLIGRRTNNFEVGVLNYVGPQLRDRIVLSETGRIAGTGLAWQGALSKVSIGDEFFRELPPPLARLVELITSPNNPFETHVIRCAEWTSQAMGDPNAASAFVKGAIALEVLFSTNEKGVITPSIMAQIAESCAYILGGSTDDAITIEREVKRLYSVRSAIVHTGKDSVDEQDLHALISICCRVIICLMSDKHFVAIDTISKLADNFRSRKYRSLDPPDVQA